MVVVVIWLRSYDNDHSSGSKVKGMADEALGNVKQAAGSLFGNESLKRDGIEQERRGEASRGSSYSPTFLIKECALSCSTVSFHREDPS
jgi:uncharacterized protein YjbJ (UPF0337 family)